MTFAIMSSQSCIEKYYDERYQIQNDDKTDTLGIMSSQSCIDKYYYEGFQKENNYETEDCFRKMM